MNTKLHSLGVLIAVLGVTGFLVLYHQMSHKPHTDVQPQPVDSSMEAEPIVQIQTYSSEESYAVGRDHVNRMVVTAEVENSVITDIHVDHYVTSEKSERHAGEFDAVYKNEIIGKSIFEAQVSRVSGSTGTSNAFNRALENIKDQL